MRGSSGLSVHIQRVFWIALTDTHVAIASHCEGFRIRVAAVTGVRNDGKSVTCVVPGDLDGQAAVARSQQSSRLHA